MENCVCEMLRVSFDIDDNLLAFDIEGNAQSNQPNPQWDYSLRWWEDSYKSTYSRQVGGSCSINVSKKKGSDLCIESLE